MADRYWVGGTASWDATVGTKWATASGGAGGASVPTSADNVFFDAASGAVTVTVAATANCLNLNFTGFTGTFAGSAIVNIAGNFVASAGMTWSFSGTLSFSVVGAKTITTNGKQITANTITLDGSSGSYTLQDNLSTTSIITLVSGSLTTNNFNITANQFASNNANTRTLSLGSSTITINNGSSTAWNLATTTNLTFNAGTSTIKLFSGSVGLGQIFSGGSLTYYNISIEGTTDNTVAFVGNNTFNSFTTASRTSPCTIKFTDGSTTTATTWNLVGSGGKMLTITNTALTTAATLAKAGGGTVVCDYVIFSWITGSPTSTWSATNARNMGNNTNITFTSVPTRYWVGGTSTWDTTIGTKWATTSGGTGGASIPTQWDDVIFDATSGTVTVTIASSNITCYDLNFTGFTGTFAASSFTTQIYGSLTISSTMTWSYISVITFSGTLTHTINTGGKTLGNAIIFSGTGTYSLQSALTSSSANGITINAGTFTTNNFNISLTNTGASSGLKMNSGTSKTVNLGSSTITIASATPIAIAATTTLNAGTSTINCTSTTTAIVTNTGGSHVFYNFSAVALTTTINGTNTYNNFTYTYTASPGGTLRFAGTSITVNGTFTSNCTAGNGHRNLVISLSGTTTTITTNSISIQNTDFFGIVAAGTAAPWSLASGIIGDCGSNSNINFPTAVTRYWVAASSGVWGLNTNWSTSSGGTSGASFPLPQDIAILEGSSTCSINVPRIGGLNSTSFSGILGNSAGINVNFYKSLLVGASVTHSFSGNLNFSGTGSNTITSNSTPYTIAINVGNGSYTLLNDFNTSSTFSLLDNGSITLNGYNLTTSAFIATGTGSSANLGSSTITITGTTNCWQAIAGNISAGTSTIVFSNSTNSISRNFLGGGNTYYNVVIEGGAATATTFSFNTDLTSNSFNSISSTKTVAHTVQFASVTTVNSFSINGTAGNLVTFARVSGAPTLTKAGGGTVTVNYASISNLIATPSNTWYATNSVDVGNNTGWTFGPAPITSNSLFFGSNF